MDEEGSSSVSEQDAEIRNRLTFFEDPENWGLPKLAGALRAVLDEHPVDVHECPARESWGESYTAYDQPCATRVAIAKALGIAIHESRIETDHG